MANKEEKEKESESERQVNISQIFYIMLISDEHKYIKMYYVDLYDAHALSYGGYEKE